MTVAYITRDIYGAENSLIFEPSDTITIRDYIEFAIREIWFSDEQEYSEPITDSDTDKLRSLLWQFRNNRKFWREKKAKMFRYDMTDEEIEICDNVLWWMIDNHGKRMVRAVK